MKWAKFRDFHDLALLVLNGIFSRFLSFHAEVILATLVGDIAWGLQRSRRRVIAERLSETLSPGLGLDRAQKLTRKIFQNMCVERFSYLAADKEDASQNITIVGLENLREAVRRGKGVILWESAFGKSYLGKATLVRRGFFLYPVHDQQHGGSRSWLGQRVIRKIYRKAENRLFPEIIDIRDDSLSYLRLLANRLRQNGIVCLSASGQHGHKFVSLEFLGSTKRFTTGTVSLAIMTGAALIPIFCIATDDAERLIIERPLDLAKTEDWDNAVLRAIKEYAGLLEFYIRKHPDQWYEWHQSN